MKFLSESHLSQKNGVAGIVSVSDWLKFMCLGLLNLIPGIGTVIYIAVLFYLSVVKNDTAESVKTYILASLLVTAISLVLGLVVVLFGFGFFSSLLN